MSWLQRHLFTNFHHQWQTGNHGNGQKPRLWRHSQTKLYRSRQLGNYGSLGVTHSSLLTWELCGKSEIRLIKFIIWNMDLYLYFQPFQLVSGHNISNIMLAYYGSRSISSVPPLPPPNFALISTSKLCTIDSTNIYINNFRTNIINSS